MRANLALAGLAPLLLAALLARQELEDSGPPAPRRETTGCVIARIIDGDTIECGGQGRIRLIGIDTPEMSQAPYGARAKEALASMAPEGSTVEIELDVEPRDRYDRLLAYVWAGGRLLNWRLVRQGWAVTYTVPPNIQYVDQLAAAQRRARADSAGLWATQAFDCLPADYRHGRCRPGEPRP